MTMYQIKPAIDESNRPVFTVHDTHGRVLGIFSNRYAATTFVVDMDETPRPKPVPYRRIFLSLIGAWIGLTAVVFL